MTAIINNGASIDFTNYLNSGTTETVIKANVKQVLVVGGNVIIKSTRLTGEQQTVKLIPSQINSPTTYANANELQAYISSILNQSVTGVLSFSAGTTGLTPSVATQGNITLGGVLNELHGGTNQSSYAIGDLLYATAVDTLGKLPVGLNGEVLTLSGGVPIWAASAGGVTTFSAGTTGLTPAAATAGAITLAGILNKANGGTAVNIATQPLTLGTASSNTGVLVLHTSANAFTTSIQTGVTGASYTLTLPTTDGAAGEFLQTDGGGVLAWASGGAALSAITAALATNTIDNTLYAQTWNWSTLSTQTAFSWNANAMTTGTMLSLATSGAAALNSTNGLLYVANTSAITNGILARFASNSTAGSGMTINTTGKIFIGTTTAIYANAELNIQRNQNDFTSIAFKNTNSTNALSSSGIEFEGVNANDYHNIKKRNATGSAYYDGKMTFLGGGATTGWAFTTANGGGSTFDINFNGLTGGTADISHRFIGVGNLILVGTSGVLAAGTSATSTLVVPNGTAPSTSPVNLAQLYAQDQVAGNSCLHTRTENGAIVKIYQETTAVAAATYVAVGGTTIQTNDTFDGYTLQQVVKSLRNQGLLA